MGVRPSPPDPRAPLPERPILGRAGLGLLAVVALVGCRNPAGPTPQYLGDTRDAHAMQGVDPKSKAGRSWSELEAVRQRDPASVEIVGLAQALLASDPPLHGRLAALSALAEQAYLVGDDAGAQRWAEQGLGQADPGDAALDADARSLLTELAITRLQAVARGGDPTIALAALGEPGVAELLTEDLRLGLRAVALDRNADRASATVAYLQWRESMADDDPSAPWAEHRARVLAASVPVTELSEVSGTIPESPAKACLTARMGGEAPGTSQPTWVARCATNVERIGIMLPRTGPLSALADEQLVAASAAADVLSSRHGAVEILWEDPGSSEAGARKAARTLTAQGADVIVGPIGPKLVSAAAKEVGESTPLVVPGEGQGTARGVAPSLEARVEALVALAKRNGKQRLIVLAPDNGYGKRAIAAARTPARSMKHDIVVRTYEAGTTSFKNTLEPITTALSEGSAVLVADHLTRAEMVVRQLARLGKMPAQGDDPGLMVMTTAEGASERALLKAGSVFDGVWASPVASSAVSGSTGRRFAEVYSRAADERPGDQAMLVYYAMHVAFTGRAAKGSGKPPIVRVVEGEFVAGSAAAGG